MGHEQVSTWAGPDPDGILAGLDLGVGRMPMGLGQVSTSG